jgi:nucleoside-diphosphate kinase
MEQSLVLIKPDGVKRNILGKIISVYEDHGLTIVNIKTQEPNRKKAEAHYQEHVQKPFYPSLLASILEGSMVAMIVEGEDCVAKIRELNGATDPSKAAPDTVRGRYGLSLQENTVHGSDSLASAEREIKIWFD